MPQSIKKLPFVISQNYVIKKQKKISMNVIDINLIYHREYINRLAKNLHASESILTAPVSVLALSIIYITKEKRKR